MARYAISAEGANAMRALASDILLQVNALWEAASDVADKVVILGDDLGIYGDEILSIVQQNQKTLLSNQEDIAILSQRVSKHAEDIDALVSMSLGTGEMGGSTQSIIGNSLGESGKPSSMVPNRNSSRNLRISEYGFEKDADGNLVYDSPDKIAAYLYNKQGSAHKDFQGTCGLCSCVNILRLAGMTANEIDMILYASNTRDPHSLVGTLCTTGRGPDENGGTGPDSRQQILAHFGIKSEVVPATFDADDFISENNIAQIANHVAAGRGVIISVYAHTLWAKDQASERRARGHAVTVTSVKKNSRGDILGFYIYDSNSGTDYYYTADKVLRSLRGTPMNVTSQVIR